MNKKILVVDDERDFVKLMKDRLEAAGYQVLVAYEGVRAIEETHKSKPDLILLDLKMPAGSGQSVLQALRAHPDTKKISIIVVTALVGKATEREARQLGANEFIRKPFDTQLLLEKIRAIL